LLLAPEFDDPTDDGDEPPIDGDIDGTAPPSVGTAVEPDGIAPCDGDIDGVAAGASGDVAATSIGEKPGDAGGDAPALVHPLDTDGVGASDEPPNISPASFATSSANACGSSMPVIAGPPGAFSDAVDMPGPPPAITFGSGDGLSVLPPPPGSITLPRPPRSSCGGKSPVMSYRW